MNGIPRSHGPTRPWAEISRCAKSGPKTSGPQTAPDTAPKSTSDMPRARRSGGNISAAAARERSTIAPAPPSRTSPKHTSGADDTRQPPATTPQPSVPAAAPARERVEEGPGVEHLGTARRAVRRRRAGMCRHDVPEEHFLLDAELVQDAVHDRRRRLGRAAPCELPLGGERNAADPRAPVTGGLADEDRVGVGVRAQVCVQPRAPELGSGVLVERRADARACKP